MRRSRCRAATHPHVFEQPLDPGAARANIGQLIGRPHIRCPGENDGFWRTYQGLAGQDAIRGNLVTDSHIAALMMHHGVSTIYTADRDFRRFPGITSVDPYTGK